MLLHPLHEQLTFSCTSNVEQNLNTLLNFVQEPYFSEKRLKREGIIGQEIQMYQDNPDWRLYFGLIDSLFVKHQLKLILQGQSNLLVKLRKIYCMNVMKHFIIRAICYYLLWVQLIQRNNGFST